MRIVWHGHSCFEIHDGIGLVTDPHDGRSIGIKPPVVKADILLISHDHSDHNCSRIVKGDYVLVKEPGEFLLKNVRIKGIVTDHDDRGGEKRGRNIVFAFEMEGIRFCHLGDLGHALTDDQIRSIGKVDVLFAPIGGVFTINAEQAKELVARMSPRVVIPMHYRFGGLSISIATVDSFLKNVPEDEILRVGNEIDFFPDELPNETEIWVFSQ